MQAPGKKEGQVIMVNMGSTVEAHQWSAASQSWQKIGEVVGSGKSKQTYEGKEYDYVFDIDIGGGPHGMLKLPYNCTREYLFDWLSFDSYFFMLENPYDAAEKFLLKHDLPQSFRDQVADFIIKNADNVNMGTGYQDPFTGGNRYTPQSSNQPTIGFTYMDPFTGAGSYRPGASNNTSNTGTYTDPFTGGGSYKPAGSAYTPPSAQQQSKVLPVVRK